jgi:ribA/ribD-fused uncharacterized protein
MEKTIQFYEGPYSALSNFSAHQVAFEGEKYMTAEHAYQVSKFKDSLQREKIRNAPSAYLAREYGQEQSGRKGQFDKVAIMKAIMSAKAEQHQDVRELLLRTENLAIEKNHPSDTYWGTGTDGKGENVMGRLWMEIRSEII